jgi:hypothetical protein
MCACVRMLSHYPIVDEGQDGVVVSAAPLAVLVELLSHPVGDACVTMCWRVLVCVCVTFIITPQRESDDTFEEQFLLLFRCFATSVEVRQCDVLCDRTSLSHVCALCLHMRAHTLSRVQVLDALVARYEQHPPSAVNADAAGSAAVRARVLQFVTRWINVSGVELAYSGLVVDTVTHVFDRRATTTAPTSHWASVWLTLSRAR